jgi:DNA-binding transcriptional regulator GbsR (MarR family)
MNQKEIVLNAMRGASKPLRTGEIAELAGLDKKEVDKAMKELKSEELIFSPKPCFWQASNS